MFDWVYVQSSYEHSALRAITFTKCTVSPTERCSVFLEPNREQILCWLKFLPWSSLGYSPREERGWANVQELQHQYFPSAAHCRYNWGRNQQLTLFSQCKAGMACYKTHPHPWSVLAMEPPCLHRCCDPSETEHACREEDIFIWANITILVVQYNTWSDILKMCSKRKSCIPETRVTAG